MSEKTAPTTALSKTEGPGGLVQKTDRLGGFLFSPQSFQEVREYAAILADSDMVPKDFKGKPGNVIVALQMGAEVGLAPMQAIQNIAVINGRPSLWGDAALALVRSSGHLEYITEEDDGKTATCRIKRLGSKNERVSTFSTDDAQKANLAGKDVWRSYPKRMRQMRARAFALRDEFTDVLKGLAVAEEMQDVVLNKTDYSTLEASMMPQEIIPQNVTPEPTPQAGVDFDPTTGEVYESPKVSGQLEGVIEHASNVGTIDNMFPTPSPKPAPKPETKTVIPEAKPLVSETIPQNKPQNLTSKVSPPPASPPAQEPVSDGKRKINPKEQKEIFVLAQKNKVPADDLMKQVREIFGKQRTADLDLSEFNELLAWIHTLRPAS